MEAEGLLVNEDVRKPVPDPDPVGDCVGLKESVVEAVIESVLRADRDAVGVSPEVTVPERVELEVGFAVPVPEILGV